MATSTKISLALALSAISATALFLLLESNLGLFFLSVLAVLFVALPAIYSWLNITTIKNVKTKFILIFILLAFLTLSILLSMSRKANGGRYIKYAALQSMQQ